MKRFALTTLAVLGIVAALAVTSSSTAEQARAAGMHGLAAAGLVVLLEVINVSGTWVWLTDTRSHVRWEAGAGVGVASVVTGACGCLSYSLLGVVAPLGLLFAVHLTFRLNQPSRPEVSQDDEQDEDVPPSQDSEDTEQDEDSWGRWDEPEPEPEDEPDTEPVPTLSRVPAGDDEKYVSQLAARDGDLPGIGAIATEFSIGKGRATRIKQEAQRRREVAA